MPSAQSPMVPNTEYTTLGDKSLLLSRLREAVQHAIQTRTWMVLICPTTKEAQGIQALLASLLPDGSSGGGRTMILPLGGRITAACVQDTGIVPQGGVFTVMFVGWEDTKLERWSGMGRWRSAASQVYPEPAERVVT